MRDLISEGSLHQRIRIHLGLVLVSLAITLIKMVSYQLLLCSVTIRSCYYTHLVITYVPKVSSRIQHHLEALVDASD